MYFDPKTVFYPKADLGYIREPLDARAAVEDVRLSLGREGINNVTFVPVETEGLFNKVYRVIDDKGDEYILKVYGLEQRWQNEWSATNTLSPLVATPILSFGKHRNNNRNVENLWHLFKKGAAKELKEVYLDPIVYAVRSLALKLTELHAKTKGSLKGYGWISDCGVRSTEKGIQGYSKTWEEYLSLNLDKHISFCANVDSITKGEADRIRKIFETHCRNFSFKSCLLHGDLNPKNILYGEKGFEIIDWEDALIGDPLYDIASRATFDWEQYNRFGVSLSLLDYYAGKDRAKEIDLRFWLYYLRISLMKSVLLRKKGDTDYTDRIQTALKYFDLL